mmetsp:Transcript_89584/g.256650  ORF Transcript_89584/g.256650 Transcript_89584/m.256650 type:complete len:244 (+) Transcript_89584:573-1304(+)
MLSECRASAAQARASARTFARWPCFASLCLSSESFKRCWFPCHSGPSQRCRARHDLRTGSPPEPLRADSAPMGGKRCVDDSSALLDDCCGWTLPLRRSSQKAAARLEAAPNGLATHSGGKTAPLVNSANRAAKAWGSCSLPTSEAPWVSPTSSTFVGVPRGASSSSSRARGVPSKEVKRSARLLAAPGIPRPDVKVFNEEAVRRTRSSGGATLSCSQSALASKLPACVPEPATATREREPCRE